MGSLFFRNIAIICKSTNEIYSLIYIVWFQFSFSFRLFTLKKKKKEKEKKQTNEQQNQKHKNITDLL